jgi:hypothetical protein
MKTKDSFKYIYFVLNKKSKKWIIRRILKNRSFYEYDNFKIYALN